MKRSRTFVAVGVVGFGLVVLGLSTSTGQDRRGTYKVETQVYGIPASPSDAARIIEAYERLSERYMNLTERVLDNSAAESKALAAQLRAIDDRLAELNARLARIEGKLGISPVPAAGAESDPNAPRGPAASPMPTTPPPPVSQN